MKHELAKVVRKVMEEASYERGRELVDFQILAMKNLYSAKKLFEKQWNKILEVHKMEILMILDSDVVSLSNVEDLPEKVQNRLVELIIIRNKEEDYLPI